MKNYILAFLLLAIMPFASAQSVNGIIINADRDIDESIIHSDTLYIGSALQIQSNTKGLRLPQLNTASRDAMNASAPPLALSKVLPGMLIYNTSDNSIQFFNGRYWVPLKTSTRKL